jgi:hypothetical protein
VTTKEVLGTGDAEALKLKQVTGGNPHLRQSPEFFKLSGRRGGRRSRDKGNRGERALVRFLQGHGFAAERVPLSGSAGGSYLGDVTVPILGVDRVAEVKVRGSGFRQIYDWLAGRDMLIVRAHRRDPLVILPLKLAAEIAAVAEGRR